MQNEPVLLEEISGRVCTLTLNRPERRNSLSPDLLKNLTRTLNNLSESDAVRAVIITGSGEKSFCAGYDLNLLPTTEEEQEGEGINPFEEAMEAVVRFPYPTIAMLNGYAFGGGCDLAVSCDIRIGAEGIRAGMVPAKLGVVYSAAGLKRFVRVLGQARTRELFFTGRTYSASILKEIGFLNYLLPKEELEAFTTDMAREISENAPLSLKGIKRVLELIEPDTLSESGQAEADQIARRSFLSDDLKEGQTAFFRKTEAGIQRNLILQLFRLITHGRCL